MDVQVRLLLKDGHVGEFSCDENDAILYGLVSTLPGAKAGASLPSDGLIHIEARSGQRLYLTRSSLVAVQISPNADSVLKNRDEQQERQPSISVSPTNFQQKSSAVDFAVITVARPTDYIHQLISSVRADLPVRLIVGSPERAYLNKYESSPFIDIIETTPQEWELFRDCSLHQRAAWNYWRALTFGACSPNPKGLVVFEDDVVPIDDWERRLYGLIDQIEARQSGPYILALYAAAESGLTAADDGAHYVSFPSERFFGNQAIYYPELVREGFAGYLKEHGVDAYTEPHDFLLGDYSQEERIPIFAAIPCLVEHIGEVSTGLAQFFHKAIHI
jgi:hypothetical protein